MKLSTKQLEMIGYIMILGSFGIGVLVGAVFFWKKAHIEERVENVNMFKDFQHIYVDHFGYVVNVTHDME